MPRRKKGVKKARTKLSRLIKKVSEGVEVKRAPGTWKGKLRVGSEFFEPLPADELSDWG